MQPKKTPLERTISHNGSPVVLSHTRTACLDNAKEQYANGSIDFEALEYIQTRLGDTQVKANNSTKKSVITVSQARHNRCYAQTKLYVSTDLFVWLTEALKNLSEKAKILILHTLACELKGLEHKTEWGGISISLKNSAPAILNVSGNNAHPIFAEALNSKILETDGIKINGVKPYHYRINPKILDSIKIAYFKLESGDVINIINPDEEIHKKRFLKEKINTHFKVNVANLKAMYTKFYAEVAEYEKDGKVWHDSPELRSILNNLNAINRNSLTESELLGLCSKNPHWNRLINAVAPEVRDDVVYMTDSYFGHTKNGRVYCSEGYWNLPNRYRIFGRIGIGIETVDIKKAWPTIVYNEAKKLNISGYQVLESYILGTEAKVTVNKQFDKKVLNASLQGMQWPDNLKDINVANNDYYAIYYIFEAYGTETDKLNYLQIKDKFAELRNFCNIFSKAILRKHKCKNIFEFCEVKERKILKDTVEHQIVNCHDGFEQTLNSFGQDFVMEGKNKYTLVVKSIDPSLPVITADNIRCLKPLLTDKEYKILGQGVRDFDFKLPYKEAEDENFIPALTDYLLIFKRYINSE
jgi:hypothetical protein